MRNPKNQPENAMWHVEAWDNEDGVLWCSILTQARTKGEAEAKIVPMVSGVITLVTVRATKCNKGVVWCLPNFETHRLTPRDGNSDTKYTVEGRRALYRRRLQLTTAKANRAKREASKGKREPKATRNGTLVG